MKSLWLGKKSRLGSITRSLILANKHSSVEIQPFNYASQGEVSWMRSSLLCLRHKYNYNFCLLILCFYHYYDFIFFNYFVIFFFIFMFFSSIFYISEKISVLELPDTILVFPHTQHQTLHICFKKYIQNRKQDLISFWPILAALKSRQGWAILTILQLLRIILLQTVSFLPYFDTNHLTNSTFNTWHVSSFNK